MGVAAAGEGAGGNAAAADVAAGDAAAGDAATGAPTLEQTEDSAEIDRRQSRERDSDMRTGTLNKK